MTETEVHQRISDLERRMRRLDDERAIGALIARYGPLVDGGAAAQTAALWTADGSYTVEDTTMSGQDGVRQMVESADHRRLIARGSAPASWARRRSPSTATTPRRSVSRCCVCAAAATGTATWWRGRASTGSG